MGSHQHEHDIVEQLNCCRAVINSLEKKVEKLECSITNKFQVIQETMNLFLRRQENMNLLWQTSALPSVTSSLPHQAESSASRSSQLCFKFEGNFPNAFLTKINIEDEIAFLTVELCDHTGKKVEVGPESFKDLKVKFLVLDGDLKDDWTEEDFKKYIASPRNNKPPLLKDNCEVSLINGSARVCGISFTDNSKWMRNGRFRLGAQLINGGRFGWIVRPAVSPPFQVKENRLKAAQKHQIPSPADKLYHLKNISKTGEIYRRAKQKDVDTVMDFLRLYHTDPNELQSILRIPGPKWKQTVDNAKMCDSTSERYKYIYHDDASGDVLVLKCDFNIESVTFKGQTSQPYDFGLFDEFQKIKIGELRKAAYKNRKELVYDPTNQTLFQAGLEHRFSVEQQERGKHEQISSNPLANHGEPGMQFDISKLASSSCTFEDWPMLGCDSTLEANQLLQEYTFHSLLMDDPPAELSNQGYNGYQIQSNPTHAQNSQSGEFRHVPTSLFQPYPSIGNYWNRV